MEESQTVIKQFYKDDTIILGEHNSIRVKKLLELHKTDKTKARIYCMNQNNNFNNCKLVFLMKKNGDFEIFNFIKKFRVGKENKLTSKEKSTFHLKFSNDKFTLTSDFYGNNKAILPTIVNIKNTISRFEKFYGSKQNILNFLGSRFSWVRFANENSALHETNLNVFISKKLFTLKKALSYVYKCPYPVAKLLNDNCVTVNDFKPHIPYISNIESLKEDWITEDIDFLDDCLKMAKTLNKKVNASWSFRRLVEEHDKWSKILNNILLVDLARKIEVGPLFLDFACFSNYQIIKTTKRLAQEGLSMNHCVGSYLSKIENGCTGIYTLKNHTLELTSSYFKGERILFVVQLVSYGNSKADENIEKEVHDSVRKFNKSKFKNKPLDFEIPCKELDY